VRRRCWGEHFCLKRIGTGGVTWFVLEHGFWMRRFGGDPAIIGRTLTLDKNPWLVIGVMPADFRPLGAANVSIFTPFVIPDNDAGMMIAARLKPGVSIEVGQAEMNVVAKRLALANPDWKNIQLRLSPVLEELTGPQRPLLLLLMGAVSFVLLIACVNVANLLLARSTARQHEIDIRLALGATRARIVRFALAEAVLISAAASLGAITLAYGGLRALKPLTGGLPRADELSIDGRVLLCALAIGIAAALLFGILPALRSARSSTAARMYSRATAKWQGTLVASEVALAFVLLVGAGLLIQTFASIRAVNLGYEPRNVLTNFLGLPPSADGTRSAGAEMYSRIRERLAGLPGVRGVATASCMPADGVLISVDVQPEGEPAQRRESRASVDVVSDGYFPVLRIPLRTGRLFNTSDREGSTPVAVVSESIANRYFHGKAIGHRMILPEMLFNLTGEKYIPTEIVGVVGNLCKTSVKDCEAEHVYLPERQSALRLTYILVRTDGDPLAMQKSVRHAVYMESPTTPLDEGRTLEDRTRYLTEGPKRAMWLLGVFAGLALALAAIGIYGVSAYAATQRSKEIGIRMALGANFTDVAALIYRSSLAASVAGLAIGAAGAAALTRLLESLLFGVSAFDPLTLVAAAFALLGIALAAATGPALRAALTDPASVLRSE
jgi:putative ABC transport system permease protein